VEGFAFSTEAGREDAASQSDGADRPDPSRPAAHRQPLALMRTGSGLAIQHRFLLETPEDPAG